MLRRRLGKSSLEVYYQDVVAGTATIWVFDSMVPGALPGKLEITFAAP